MNYCFAKLRPAVDDYGKEPDLPDGLGYLLLADSRSSEWNLYEYSSDNNKEINIVYPVSNKLKRLLISAMRFPPAIALTRDDISRKFEPKTYTVEEFQAAIITSLKRRLSSLSKRRFFLLETQEEEFGYIECTEWYWVIAASKDKSKVYWISDDYFIYTNPASYFKITDKQLEILSQ